MKKLIALISALSLVLVLASCGDDKPAETSSAASTPAPVSSVAPTVVPTIEPTPTPEPVVDNNLAHAEDATIVDMNTGKTDGDEGYIQYYGNDANNGAPAAFDGDMTTGWQTCENFGDAVTEEDVNAAADPSLYWQSALDNTQWFLKPTYEDGTMWIGVTFEEAKTVDTVVASWEGGAAPMTVEDDGYYFQFTEDGEKWEKLDVSVTREEIPVGDNVNYTDTASFDAKEVKGVRVVMLKTSSKYAPKLWEMEIYAPAEETPAESVEEAAE